MDNLTGQILIGLATSIIGAFLGYFIPLILQYSVNKQREGMKGKWLSYGHTGSNKALWIEDEVEISLTLFGIILKNKNLQFKYRAKGQLIDSRQLSGTWYSERLGAYDSGPFMFVISPQGNYMYGVYVGRNENGTNLFLGWCLGRDKDSLESAKISLTTYLISKEHIT